MSAEDKILMRLQQQVNDIDLMQKFRQAKGTELLKIHIETCACCVERTVRAYWFFSDEDLISAKSSANRNIEKLINKVKLGI